MAKSMDGLPDYLRARGFNVVGVPGWRNRKRPAYTGGYEPRGIVAHHTGSKANGLLYASTTLAEGFSTLPGPLCQLSLNRAGTVIFVAAGRANHAGKCRTVGFMQAGDGNTQALGIEAMNTGTEGWGSPAGHWGTQYKAYVALCAAVEDYMGWARGSTLGHGEVSVYGKWDPGVKDAQTGEHRMIDMPKFRAAIKAVKFTLTDPVEPPVVVPPAPAEPTPEPVPPVLEPAEDDRYGKWELINHAAASGVFDIVKWRRRRVRVVQMTQKKKPDILGGLECGGRIPMHYLTTKYSELAGLRKIVGEGGRVLSATKNAAVHKSGIFHPHMWSGNDIEAPWMFSTINGQKNLTVLAHLDPRSSTAHKVRVANQLCDFIDTKRAEFGLKKRDAVLMIDMADKTGDVRATFIKRGYASVFKVADKTVNSHLSSITYFKKPFRGVGPDDIFVWNGAAPRDAHVASKTAAPEITDLDHLVLTTVLKK